MAQVRHFNGSLREAFVVLHRAVGKGSKPWHGAVVVQGNLLSSTSRQGEIWVQVPLDGIDILDGLLIPNAVAAGLGQRRYSGAQVRIDDRRVVISADHQYLFPADRRWLGRRPPVVVEWLPACKVEQLSAEALRITRALEAPLEFGLDAREDLVMIRSRG